MQAEHETVPTPTPSLAPALQRGTNGRRAVQALLREHPDAVLYTQAADGLLVAPPESIGVDGYTVLATEGRTGMDLCVAEDRMAMVTAWIRVKREAVAEARARLCSDPDQWMVVRLLDLRKRHGVVLSVLWPTGEAPEDAGTRVLDAPSSATPRFCTRKQDEEANVFECDDAYLQMFGYAAEEVIGNPTFERVHPHDQARMIEGWIATVATGRMQMFRVRMRRLDGSWLWVDTTLHNYLDDGKEPHVLAEGIDVWAEMAAQEALQDREELLRNLIEEMPDGLLQLDRERRVVYHNAPLLEILHGRTELGEVGAGSADGSDPDPAHSSQITLETLLRTLTREAMRSFEEVVERALEQAVRQDVELEAAPPFGQRQHLLVKVRPLRPDGGEVTGLIASVQDVTDSTRARRELEARATFDALTGAHNRSSIMAALSEEIERTTETGVIYVDLDRFKPINDTLGHAAGDEVLASVAERLKAAMRAGDDVGRLGGDEFLIVLRGVSGLGVAMSAARRISDALHGELELSCGRVQLRASVGVACVDEAMLSAEDLVERADAAMYRSKQERRGSPVLAA